MKRSRRRYAGLTPAELHVMVDTLADIGTDLSAHWEEITRRMNDALPGQPGAQSYDRPLVNGGTRATPWCDVCEADRCIHDHGLDTITEGRRAGELILWCRTMDVAAEHCGHRIEQAIQRPDPTGRVALLEDRVVGDIEANAKDVKTAFDALVRVALRCGQYTGHAAPSAKKREVAAERPWPACECCIRASDPEEPKRKWYQASETRQPSTLNRNLPAPMLLCAWCAKFVRKTGNPPTKKESVRHSKGESVFVFVDGQRLSA